MNQYNDDSLLTNEIFEVVINSAPLVSVDLIFMHDHKVLLGRRVNKPAQHYFFTMGGRVKKNESLSSALYRIAQDEVGIELTSTPSFVGVFEHFYKDAVFNAASTHYVNIAYQYIVEDNLVLSELPCDQHSEYRWMSIDSLLNDQSVHQNVKNYFSKESVLLI